MTKADTIRLLHAERCSPAEIAAAVAMPVYRVRAFINRMSVGYEY